MLTFTLNHCISSILIVVVALCVFAHWSVAYAASDSPFQIIPKAEDESYSEKVEKLQKPNTDFRNEYNEIWDEYDASRDLWAALSSGIVTRDTILILVTRVVKIISQMWLVVWSGMFIYAWYLYWASVFWWDQTSKANDAMKNAVIWLVIIIFSYAINRIVLFAFVT